ncbi:MAG: hypothetical protein R6U61_01125 [Thermoplasmata archaeon]
MSLLGDQYVAELFLFLLEREEVNTVDLKDISSYYQGIMRKAEELNQLGFVEIEELTDPYLKRTFRLTSRGREVAEKLKEAENLLHEEIKDKI